jgi:regulator of replication initiation timing
VKHALNSIYGTEISEALWKKIILEVQKKKELKTFSESYIKKYGTHLLKKNSKLRKLIDTKNFESFKNSKEFQKLIKDIREKARRIYGLYIHKKYYQKDTNNVEEILATHRSTKERLSIYDDFYKKITEATCNPQSILDLGCGLNPASIGKLGVKVTYYASDICEQDIDFLNSLFKIFKTKKIITEKSNAFRLDLSEEKDIEILKKYKTDWCFLLKALDPIEESHEDITYTLIPAIQSKWIIASFPIITASNQLMRNPRRNWFEKVLKRVDKKYSVIQIGNELCYIVKNEP